jgi:hypothetical protein
LLDTSEVNRILDAASESDNLDLLWRTINDLSNDGWEKAVQRWLRANPGITKRLLPLRSCADSTSTDVGLQQPALTAGAT